jgi:hypothetical protein
VRYEDNVNTPTKMFRFLCDLDLEDNVNLLAALSSFDGGALFGKTFLPLAACGPDEMESYAKRHFHLLVQLTLTRPSLLVSFLDLYGTAVSLERAQSQGSGGDFLAGLTTALPPNAGHVLRKTITSEVLNIKPAKAIATSSKAADTVFESLLRADPRSLPMLIGVLGAILDDHQIPASDNMVRLVSHYFDSLSPENRDIRLIIPILGGLSKEAVEARLPYLILELKDDLPGEGRMSKTDYLLQCFSRITNSRPPPLSRAHLLVSLHRF